VLSVGDVPRLHNGNNCGSPWTPQSKMIEKRWQRVHLAVAADNWIESSGVGSWQMMEEQRVQLRVESPAVKRSLYVCCNTVKFGVCITGIIPMLESVVSIRLVKMRTLVFSAINCKVLRLSVGAVIACSYELCV
jgi:hypothetical protein